MNLPVKGLNTPADLLKIGACVVRNYILIQDTATDLGSHTGYRLKTLKIRIQTVRKLIDCLMATVGFDLSCTVQKASNGKKLT